MKNILTDLIEIFGTCIAKFLRFSRKSNPPYMLRKVCDPLLYNLSDYDIYQPCNTSKTLLEPTDSLLKFLNHLEKGLDLPQSPNDKAPFYQIVSSSQSQSYFNKEEIANKCHLFNFQIDFPSYFNCGVIIRAKLCGT